VTRSQALVALSVWVLLSVALAATDARPSVIVLFGIVAVVAVVIVLVLDLPDETAAIEWHRQGDGRPTGGVDQRVRSLRDQLYSADALGSDELRVTLVELIDDRLLVHRNIDRVADPAAATAALSPTLRRLVGGPRRSRIPVRELDRILTDIEAL